MDIGKLRDNLLNSENLHKDFLYLGITLIVALVFIGAGNLKTPDNPVKVGYTEVYTQCIGIDAGVCLGVQKRTYKTFNYDNYTNPEPGTANYYRNVESHLMLQAYNICDSNVTGMEWTDQASYLNKTGTEWLKNEDVQLLPCSQTFYRPMDWKP
ncbi:MAG: hypothetical protein ABEJ99_01260 [Candidatus Nanohaloarchaea archaeon]